MSKRQKYKTKKYAEIRNAELEAMAKHLDYIKANRKGSRDAELEGKTGWTAKHKVHRSAKAYNRKDKRKFIENSL